MVCCPAVACADGTKTIELTYIVIKIICCLFLISGRLVMFRADSFVALLSASLTWETFEQFCLWQLVTAHGIPINYVLPILPRLEFSNHAEALTSILLMLKQEK